jgi:type I restriction enzyme R subunit
MSKKEASARIKINKLLEESGWRFEAGPDGSANIHLEPGVKFASLGDDFEHQTQGFIDFLLLDVDGRPLVVVEAKKESIDPLSAKEQARKYAHSVGARFIIMSNGNIHYFWDTKHGNPDTISKFPTQESLTQHELYVPDPEELAKENIDENYIIASQMPSYLKDPDFNNPAKRLDFLRENNLKQMRPYQVAAIKKLQAIALEGNSRFLFEMATGTGKTLTSAAVSKLFLKSGNAKRVLFLVDRLELEDQAAKAFKQYLGKDYISKVFKENRESWQNAQIVISTIQTLQAGDKYKKEFSPTDFELVISDEAHRSIGGNSRAIFEYFVGYKLGLTATPKNYLRGFGESDSDTQREFERRQLLDTYKTFGCEPGQPTFSYDLISGVKDNFLVNPLVIDARTDITAKLLSDEGYSLHTVIDEGESINAVFDERHYERKFFNNETNVAMAKAFIDNGALDPVAEQNGVALFGKSIVFCVSQSHAARVTNILNKLAQEKWPGYYTKSDFAIQITSAVYDAQQMTINFANNTLNGKVKNLEGYESSHTRVAVTVGMMTTGYDCEDILNIGLMRPVFSPSDFVQIKGRGTRKHTFRFTSSDTEETFSIDKTGFKLFDFFASCEYFESEYPYDEKIKLPRVSSAKDENAIDESESTYIDESGKTIFKGPVDLNTADEIVSYEEKTVNPQGMRIDREGFKRAVEEDVLSNEKLKALWENGDVAGAEDYAKSNIFDKPNHYLNLGKVKSAFNVDRRITVREFLQVAFGQKDGFESKDELLEAEWSKFTEINPVDQAHYACVKTFFKAYIVDEKVREIIASRQSARFNTESSFHFEEYQKLDEFKSIVPNYIKDYVSLNTFMK